MHFSMYLFYNFCILYMFRTTISFNRETEQLGRFARFAQSCRYSNLWTHDDERNSRSKYVDCTKIVE